MVVFWGGTLDLHRIRLLPSAVAAATGRAFVIHDTIYWPGAFPEAPTTRELGTLVHELAHCWQHQAGRWQLLRGIGEQAAYTLLGRWLVRLGLRPLYDPYDYGGPIGLAAADDLHGFRLEAQAAIIEHHWYGTIGAEAVGGEALRDADGSPTRFAVDLARLCAGAGLPGRPP